MKNNMGKWDRGLRISSAIIIAILYLLGFVDGYLALVLGAFSLVFVITSFLGFCPLYLPLGISTCSNKK